MEQPSWINEELLEVSLRNFFESDSLKILDYSCKLAINEGENYTTHVYRISTDFIRNKGSGEENICLIIKCMREGLMSTLAEQMDLFPKEIDMFVNILPEMEKIYGSKNILSAACINASLEPHQFIILQDMCAFGYQVKLKQSGLDTEHTLKILEKMAIFHASSRVLLEKKPSILKDMYFQGIFRDIEGIRGWLNVCFDTMTEMTENFKDLQIYHEKLKKLCQNGIIEDPVPVWSSFNVINHGDSWVNNMMFCYEENGKLKDCIYLDFQLSVYGSPVIDLHYFISSSLADDIIQDVDYFLDYYYVQLLKALNKMKYSLEKVPSLNELKAEFRKHASYGVKTMASTTALVKSSTRSDASFNNFMANGGEGSFRHHCYNNNAYKNALIQLLPVYEKFGVFS